MDETPQPNLLEVLQNSLEDSPENILILDALKHPEAKAHQEGNKTTVETPESILYAAKGNFVLRRNKDSEELFGIVSSVDTIATLLTEINGWTCCSVAEEYSEELGAKFAKDLNREVTYLPCKTYTCENLPEYELQNPEIVRLATMGDVRNIITAGEKDEDFAGFTPQRLEHFIQKGLVAIAEEEGKIVAIVSAEAITNKHVMFMYYTNPEYRKKGLTSDGHFLVLQSAIKNGLRGITSIADSNEASIRASTKFGYEPVANESYFIIGNPPYSNTSA